MLLSPLALFILFTYLVVSGVPVLDTQVIGMQFHLEMRKKKLLLDEVPDDPGHLIAEHVNNRSGLDLGGHLETLQSEFPIKEKIENVVEMESPFAHTQYKETLEWERRKLCVEEC
jgi:hypothetical protein